MSTKEIAKTQSNTPSTASQSPSERFTNAVMREFPNGGSQEVELTSFQRKIINNYFIKIDESLRASEVKRMAKSEQYRESLPYKWENVNMRKLALDVVAFSSVGLDPLQPNQINPIPYKNSKTNQFDITMIEGYNGLELKAVKYGLDVPDDVIFELKYSNDDFKSLKKNYENRIENYHFEIIDDFDRGELMGGFYYKIYFDKPEKNQLVVMDRKAIEKRKPKYASAEFWGGEKDEWKNGQKTGNKEKVEGWEEEMFLKTLKRHCWNSINIDSSKIDEHLQRILHHESERVEHKVSNEIYDNANKTVMDIEDVTHEEVKQTPQIENKTAPQSIQPNKVAEKVPSQSQTNQGPGF